MIHRLCGEGPSGLRAGRTLALAVTALILVAGASLPASEAQAQAVPSPREHFGFELGTDRRLADWTALSAYYARLAATSPRVSIDTLGTTTKGRAFVMLTITSPANHRRLTELHSIQSRLADPRMVLTTEERDALVREGKTVVMITHAIHSTEVGSSQVAARLAHRLATSQDPRILEILDNVILLQIPSLNPDGTEWVADWYQRWAGTEYEAAPLPWLYHFYTGHDNNRDWYAFTQAETRMTVAAQNRWHPQIVHDIHQMGGSGARIFFPPFIDPVEPNVDPAIVAGINQLGAYMAAELTAQGKAGVVINAIYDAWTPARAYMHYHGGVRILSETASARIATPVVLEEGDVGGGREYDAATASWKIPNPWTSGRWALSDILDYMEAGALALLTNAAKNRELWLRNFYGINRRAVEGWPEWPAAWVVPAGQANREGVRDVLRILATADVEVQRAQMGFRAGGRSFPAGSWVVRMAQPYASFAQTMLERQVYPDLREYPGGPPKRPYDVTAHTLPYLMGIEAVPIEEPIEVTLSQPIAAPEPAFVLPPALTGEGAPRIGLYKGWREPMESGWTRWVFDRFGLAYDTIGDARIRSGGLREDYDVILFQSQSGNSIVEGFSRDALPAPYSGGIGEDGRQALARFVRNGGRIVAIEEAAEFVGGLLGLGVVNATDRLPPQEFYVPGSILRIELSEDDPVTAGGEGRASVPPGPFGNLGEVAGGLWVPGWYGGSSRAFDVTDPTVEAIAWYGEGNPLLSGWILGPRHLAGRPAIVRANVGAGSVILFGFQPNYRAQTRATWPLLLNALVPEGPIE